MLAPPGVELIIAAIYIPAPVYGHSVEITLLERLRNDGPALINAYIDAHTREQTCFVSRDAAKTIFPEYLQNPVLHNRFADAAASALADAVRRTLLERPVQRDRDWVVIVTGSPASGKTRSASPRQQSEIEILHETILTALPRATELIEQALTANRFPVIHLFYTQNPRINVQRMISRARAIGRTVPLSYMAKTYVNVPRIVGDLKAHFGDILRVLVTNNSQAGIPAVDHNRVDWALDDVNRYTEKTALEAMHAELDKIIGSPDGVPPAILDEALRS